MFMGPVLTGIIANAQTQSTASPLSFDVAAAQPFGKNGIIVMVPTNEKHEPRAPRMPSFLFQNPKNKNKSRQSGCRQPAVYTS
jgi:hypothetical protein